jgi:hypothetical protein
MVMLGAPALFSELGLPLTLTQQMFCQSSQ